MNATQPIDLVLSKLPNAKPDGDGWRARCPVHNGKSDDSLSIKESSGTVLLTCHGGCEFIDIVHAIDLEPSDLFSNDGKGKSGGLGKIVDVSDYTDADGKLLYQAVRFYPKAFRPRRPDGNGGWEYKLKGTPLVLYRLPDLIESAPSDWVYLVEGEKSADAIAELGSTVTTSQGGADGWKRGAIGYAQALRGRRVCILPDNDPAGRKYANDAARSLVGVAADVRILALPDLQPGQDPFDWVERGGSAAELTRLAETTKTPEIEIIHTSPAEWPVFTLVDAYQERDPLVYVVADLFSLPSLSIVYGSPGCLKSMLLADAALCVAGGLPWLPSLPNARVNVYARATVSVPVLWLDFDNGTRRTHERIEALGRARDLDAEATSFYYVSMPTPWLDGNDAVSVAGLIALAKSRSVGLIIIDNLGTVSGDADENSTQMVQVMANFRLLAEDTGAAVVVIHHQRKSTGFNSRAGESLRGNSSIEAALDLALLVSREESASEVAIQSTKTRGTDVVPFGAQFAYEHKRETKELAKAQFYGVPMVDNRKPARAQRAILEALEEAGSPPNKSSLIRMAREATDKIGVNYFRETITKLVQSGDIIETDTGKDNARLYSLA